MSKRNLRLQEPIAVTVDRLEGGTIRDRPCVSVESDRRPIRHSVSSMELTYVMLRSGRSLMFWQVKVVVKGIPEVGALVRYTCCSAEILTFRVTLLVRELLRILRVYTGALTLICSALAGVRKMYVSFQPWH